MEQLLQLSGLGGIALIKQIIDKISTDKTSGLVKVIYSLILALIINEALSIVFGTDWKVALAVGLLTGVASNVYNDKIVS